MTGRPTGALLPAVLVPAGVLAGWQLLGWSGVLKYDYLPTPLQIAGALAGLAGSGELVGALAHTVAVAGVAAVLALAAGAAFGLAIGLLPAWSRWVTATVDVARTVPAVALVPVAVLALGPTVRTELLLACYAALWPVVLTTAGGVAAVHPRQYDVARMLRLSRAATIRKIVLPAALPAWLVGARLAVITALLVAIVVEMLLYPRGLGGALMTSFNALAPARMWAYAAVCGVLGAGLSALLRRMVTGALPAGPVTVPGAVDQPGTPLRGLLPLAALLAAAQLLAQPNSLTLPPPSEWLTALARLQRDGVLLPAVAHTLSTYALGLLLAGVIGLGVGAAVGFSRRLDRALTPSIDVLAAVPAAALLPAAVLLLGPGPLAGAMTVGVIVAWPVLLSVAAAARAVPHVRREMSRMLGLSNWRRWRHIGFPSVLPGLLLGLRVAAALALIVTLLADIFGVGHGIGRLLVISQQTFDAAAAWGLLLLVGLFGYLASAGLRATTRAIRR